MASLWVRQILLLVRRSLWRIVADMGDGINKAITNKENEYQAERKAVGADGFDIARFAGNVASL